MTEIRPPALINPSGGQAPPAKKFMKNSAKNLLTITLAALGLSAVCAQAQGTIKDLNEITVSLTMDVQGSFTDDGTTRVYSRPVTAKRNTKDLLNQIARDKFAQGQYNANTFPPGAKLGLTGDQFVVVNAANQLLVDVSDLIQWTRGSNTVLNGRINDTTGLADTKLTVMTFVTLAFDDTFVSGGGNMNYVLTGVDTQTIQDKLVAGNNYQENTSDSVKNAAGEGQTGGTPFIVTGTIKGHFNASLPMP